MYEAELLALEEMRLLHLLRDPKLGAYLSTKISGVHYLMSSGLHTDELYQIPAACRFEYVRRSIAELIMKKMKKTNLAGSIDIFVGVAMGGVPLAFELQRDPSFMGTEVLWVDKERDPKRVAELKVRRRGRFKKEINPKRPEFVLGRNFKIDPSKRVAIVEDVYSTGDSIRAAIDACSDSVSEDDPEGGDDSLADANVVGVIVAVNRSPEHTKPSEILMPAITLVQALRDPMYSFSPGECPWCSEGIPLVKI